MANYGWNGKILRVNLNTGTTSEEDTSNFEPEKFIGGRGFGARVAWKELPPDVGPFDPENRLMFMPGPLTGTLAPGSGRCTVCGVAAQNSVISDDAEGLYSWSGIGGSFGTEIKFAGYDGIIIQGKSSEPVYLYIEDGNVEVKSAEGMWGKGTYAAMKEIMKKHGKETKVAAIGPAGENESSIAAITNDSESAAGQGGFGGVMGSKKLKAIAIKGSEEVKVDDHEALLSTVKEINHEVCWPVSTDDLEKGYTSSSYSVDSHSKACTLGCQGFCGGTRSLNYPGDIQYGEVTTFSFCASIGDYEVDHIGNQLGINFWDFAYGIVPILQYASKQDWLNEVDGLEIPAPEEKIINSNYADTPKPLLVKLMRKLAYREDELGDLMAEGGVEMARELWEEETDEILSRIYPGVPDYPIGYTGHWDCHWKHGAVGWPHWLVSSLIWATSNRDPANDSVHHFTDNIALYPEAEMMNGEKLSWDKVREVSERLYGYEGAMDYEVTYDPPEAKASAAVWHRWRGALVASLLLCDWQMPRVFTLRPKDGPQTYPQAEAEMFSAVTGINMSEEELDKAGERIWNLERAIDVRYGRNRDWDESIIPYFEHPSMDAEGEGKHAFDAEEWKKQLTAFYELSGWDTETGRPTRSKLEELDLDDVADQLEEKDLLPS
ncbi:MAG: Aldehyde:ferredoxin oxidoreductase [Candidatus Methanohalarchaeum thermophilum]|uniref:Aldehyde:ferredoxin oxidoreductase n=1 Tax=Methanohalarchaeum thermophilum TaxID=1903181 RepID=A0A1Q6DXL1_METT1|nr:MAG: Aldehyde:ferredoxin oxidoreductase [Candidatus Methanohalarchaeum thermophilum]